MRSRKEVLEQSRDALVEKAEDCSDLAKAQRENADKQHESAHKLEKLSHALREDAGEIADELEVDNAPAGSRAKAQPPGSPA